MSILHLGQHCRFGVWKFGVLFGSIQKFYHSYHQYNQEKCPQKTQKLSQNSNFFFILVDKCPTWLVSMWNLGFESCTCKKLNFHQYSWFSYNNNYNFLQIQTTKADFWWFSLFFISVGVKKYIWPMWIIGNLIFHILRM